MQNTIIFSGNSMWSMHNFRLTTMQCLKEDGYRIVVLSPRDECSEMLLKMGFEVCHIELDRKGVNVWSEFKLLIKYVKIYKQINPDLIFHYTVKPNIYGTVAASVLHIPAIAVVTGLGYLFTNRTVISVLVGYLYKMVLKLAYKTMFLNSDDLDLFVKKGLVDVNKTGILPGEGVDVERYKSLCNYENIREYDFLLVARMLWDKGVMEYVKAAEILREKHPDVFFGLLGPVDYGNPAAISEEQIMEWDNDGVIKYLGVTDDVKGVLEKTGCVVLPSYREGVPRALLEAASMSLPLIASNVPGCRDVVDDCDTGFLCEDKNISSLASAMSKIIALKSEEKIKMGEMSRAKIVRMFSDDVVLENYTNIINEVCLSG